MLPRSERVAVNAGDSIHETNPNSIGSKLINQLKRYSVLGGVVLSLHASSANKDQLNPSRSDNQTLSPALISPNPLSPNVSGSTSTLNTNENNCTYISDFPEGYYLGLVCKIPGNVIYKVDSSFSKKYLYGVIDDDGIYKCGWIKSGVIKTIFQYKKSIRQDMKYCRKIEESLKHPSTHFQNLNCRPKSCEDGYKVVINDFCDHTFYANFASSNKSAFNLRPTLTNSGFSMPIGNQYDNALWRGDLNMDSKDGFASDVRSKSIGMWGFISEVCDYTSLHPSTTIKLTK